MEVAGFYLGSLGMCSDRLVSRTAMVKPMSLAGLWKRSVNSLKSTLPSWLASTHIMMYSISSLWIVSMNAKVVIQVCVYCISHGPSCTSTWWSCKLIRRMLNSLSFHFFFQNYTDLKFDFMKITSLKQNNPFSNTEIFKTWF